MKSRNYSGYEIVDQAGLLEALATRGIHPIYDQVVCEHVTHQYPATETAPVVSQIEVVGHAASDGVQALLVRVNGKVSRPDGKVYHVTLSLAEGHKPVESNDLLASAVEEGSVEDVDPVRVAFRPF